MVVWFLDHGADPNKRCDWDLTPTSYAMSQASLKIILLLFERGADPRCGQLLHHAVLREKDDTVRLVELLVQKGAPIDEIQYENDPQSNLEHQLLGHGTALHSAAEHGKLEVVQALLDLGAN
jgi:ankyrin repeat protein